MTCQLLSLRFMAEHHISGTISGSHQMTKIQQRKITVFWRILKKSSKIISNLLQSSIGRKIQYVLFFPDCWFLHYPAQRKLRETKFIQRRRIKRAIWYIFWGVTISFEYHGAFARAGMYKNRTIIVLILVKRLLGNMPILPFQMPRMGFQQKPVHMSW